MQPHLAQDAGWVCEQGEGQALCCCKCLVVLWGVAADAKHLQVQHSVIMSGSSLQTHHVPVARDIVCCSLPLSTIEHP